MSTLTSMQPRARPRAPAPAGGRAQQKAATRAGLLAAARRVIAIDGFDRATTRAVAAEAGVAVGTVFAHFPDVGALAEALLDEHIGEALARAERTRPRKGDVVTRLVHVARALYDSYDVDPALSRAYLAASLFRVDPAGPAAARLAGFERWVVDELTAHGPRGLDPRLAFTTFFALYFALLIAGLRGQLDRRRQLATLEAGLRQAFRLEAP